MFSEVLNFWFKKVSPKQWFVKDLQFDQMIIDLFEGLHQQAIRCELYLWRDSPKGRLAEIIVLDQFSRNIFRDKTESFLHDAQALALAQEAIRHKADLDLTPVEKSFLYMPYMHSESLAIHEVAEELYSQPGLENNYDFELKHKRIIERFGRYPHRNKLLGRESTDEEIKFLKEPDSSF